MPIVASFPALDTALSLTLPFLHIEDSIRPVPLREYRLMLRDPLMIFLPSPIVARKTLGSNSRELLPAAIRAMFVFSFHSKSQGDCEQLTSLSKASRVPIGEAKIALSALSSVRVES
jgi:hypothetical protein